jgi:N-terminal half of MaoC dehydratase
MQFPIEVGHVLAFARAVGEPAPEVGQIAPPTFTATSIQHDPEHMRGMRPSGPLATVAGDGGAVLHAEQHFEYLAPVRVGDVLTVSEAVGRSWAKIRRQGGALEFTEHIKELRDDHGEVVVRSRMVLVTVGPDPVAAT